jgi:molybdopterin-guanine dinucleotide biosynthesis protein A
MGKDKAALPFMGEALIQRIVSRGQGLTDNVLVITNRPQEYEFLEVALARDLLPIKGPLVGLFTALSVSKTEYLILVGCDMPFINTNLLTYQLSILEHEPFDVVIPKHADGFEPLHSVYRRDICLKQVETALEQGERSLMGWLEKVRVCEISERCLRSFEPDLLAFTNLNTPADYQKAEKYEQSRLISASYR